MADQDQNAPRFPKGYYRARAVSAVLDQTKDGKPSIAVEFELLDEGYAGQHITWWGYFTDKTTDRTFEALRYCGWTGDDVSVFANGSTTLENLGTREVSLDIGIDTYEGKTRSRVLWVNDASGPVAKAPMTLDQAKVFAERMKAAAQRSRSKLRSVPASPVGRTGTDDSDLPPF